MGKLSSNYQIIKLARDLQVSPEDDAARSIIAFCLRTVRRFRKEYPCETLDQLLEMAATNLSTTFVEIHSDEELAKVKRTYLEKGETGFIRLDDLNANVFAITFQLQKAHRWSRKFVSVIDCRGSRASRAYFSKWHELAHLLTQTDQMRLVFTRTHAQLDIVDPEEALMEQIAGAVGFLPDIIRPHIQDEISFDEIERLRKFLCPSASQQSSYIGIVKAWPEPAMYVEAKIALRKSEQRRQRVQPAFSFVPAPTGELRAVTTVQNEIGRSKGLSIHPNMRVPSQSVLAQVFNGNVDDAEALENLSSWASSDGTSLPSLRVKVKAMRAWEGGRGLITLA